MTDKTLPQPNAPHAKRRTFTPYVIVWASLAALSLLYLGLLAAQPTVVADMLGAPPPDATAETAAQPSETDAAVAEVRALRDTLDQFRSELIEMRTQISSQSETASTIANRVAALEAIPAEAARVAAESATKTDAAKLAKAAKKNAAEPAPQVAAKDAPKDTKAAKKKELETGSVASPAAGAITFGPATVTPTAVPPAADIGRQVGVQIATGPSVDSLRLSWTLLNERHGDSLRAFEPRYTMDASGPNQSYDLVVGPLANADEARRLCQELALKATPCSVSRFTGDAL